MQEQGKWLTMRTVSAGSGHGPILVGKLEAEGTVAATTTATAADDDVVWSLV